MPRILWGLRGRLEGVLNFIKEENLECSLLRKGLVSGLLMSTFVLTLLTTSSVIGEESKVYAKSNSTDENILMRVDTKNGTEELKEKSITVSIKTGSGGRSFGSVSTKELAAAAKAQLGYDLDKKKMVLDVPIKSPGIFTMPIKLHPQVTGELKVIVKEA